MDDEYYRYQAGHPKQYAAYEKEFHAGGIDPTGDPEIDSDPEASYEIDNAYELAYERMIEAEERQFIAEDMEERIIPLLHQAENATLDKFEAEANPVADFEAEPW